MTICASLHIRVCSDNSPFCCAISTCSTNSCSTFRVLLNRDTKVIKKTEQYKNTRGPCGVHETRINTSAL